MSRKFIDDHVRKLSLTTPSTELPGNTSTAYQAGHEFQDHISGVIYKNHAVSRKFNLFSSIRNRYRLEEKFARHPQLTGSLGVAANLDFELLGMNAADADVSTPVTGGITITTAGADGDSMIVTPHLATDQSGWAGTEWDTSANVLFEAMIRTGANITNAVIWAGLKLTNVSVTATDDDQIMFRYEDDVISGNWQTVDSTGGTDNAQDTNIVVAVSTLYYLKIVVDDDLVPYYIINDTLLATGAALTADTALIPYIGVEADGAAAAKAIDATYLSCERNL